VQFPEVTLNSEVFHPGQANNSSILSAIGPAAYAARLRWMPEACFIAVAQVTAARVADFIFDNGLLQAERPRDARSWSRSASTSRAADQPKQAALEWPLALITHWIITRLFSRFVDKPTDLLGGTLAVVAAGVRLQGNKRYDHAGRQFSACHRVVSAGSEKWHFLYPRWRCRPGSPHRICNKSCRV
jgi:hypothetical protein